MQVHLCCIIVKINLELIILGARDQNQMALELVMATGPLNMRKIKEDDVQKKATVQLPSRVDADALRTCWRCLARITLDRRHKRWQTHLVSVGVTLWG